MHIKLNTHLLNISEKKLNSKKKKKKVIKVTVRIVLNSVFFCVCGRKFRILPLTSVRAICIAIFAYVN